VRLLTKAGLVLVVVGIGLLSTVRGDRWNSVPRSWKLASDGGSQKRVLYPYSVIPGGVYGSAELNRKLVEDGVAREHYRGFNSGGAWKTKAEFSRPVYLSYRKGDQIYWTRRPVGIPEGEILLTDGFSYVRARCGNRIAETPGEPVEPLEEAPPPNIFGDVDGPPLGLIPFLPMIPPPNGLGDESIIQAPFANPESLEEGSGSAASQFPVWSILVGIGAGAGTAVGLIGSSGGGSPVAIPPDSSSPPSPGGEPMPLPSEPVGPLRPTRFPVLGNNPAPPSSPGGPNAGTPGTPPPPGGPNPGTPGTPSSPSGPNPGTPGTPSAPPGNASPPPGIPSNPGAPEPTGSPVGSNPIGGVAPIYPVVPPNGGGENPATSVTPEPPMAIPIGLMGVVIAVIAKISRNAAKGKTNKASATRAV
jgi:hypothetical protein